MPQSLATVQIHLVFSTKCRAPWITDDIRERFHQCVHYVMAELTCPVTAVNSMADHIHVLFALSRTIALAKVVEHLKVATSKWMKVYGHTLHFSWQVGYFAASVDRKGVSRVAAYIENQQLHHRGVPWQAEVRALAVDWDLNLDERYAWD